MIQQRSLHKRFQVRTAAVCSVALLYTVGGRGGRLVGRVLYMLRCCYSSTLDSAVILLYMVRECGWSLCVANLSFLTTF